MLTEQQCDAATVRCSGKYTCMASLVDEHAHTVPLQKSTTVYPGLASSVTMATKLFSCCLFLAARIFDIFPAKKSTKFSSHVRRKWRFEFNKTVNLGTLLKREKQNSAREERYET